MGAKRPPWIVNETELVLRHPYKLSDVTLFSFAVPSSFERLKTLIDTTLNPAGKTTYCPIAPFILATFLRSDQVVSLHPEDRHKGRLRERELSFAIPLVAFSPDWNLKTPILRIVWYMPALWLDCPTALTAGREVFGYPKQWGQVTMPHDIGGGETAQFEVSAHVIRAYDRNESADLHPIVAIVRKDRDQSLKASISTRFREVLQEAFGSSLREDLKFFGLNDPVMQILRETRRHLVDELRGEDLLKLVFLKQFPAVEDSRESGYQAVLETAFHIDAFRRGGFLEGNFQLTCPRYDSLNLPEIFGFEGTRHSDGSFVTEVPFGIFADFDFSLESGETILQRG